MARTASTSTVYIQQLRKGLHGCSTSADLLLITQRECSCAEQILKNHIVPGEVLNTSQLQSQAAPLPTLTGQSLQARPRRQSVLQHARKHRRPVPLTAW